MDELIFPQGINFRYKDVVSVSDLSTSLCKIVKFLQSIDPTDQLVQYEDWWEHDGFFFKKKNIDFQTLKSLVESADALRNNTPKDHNVLVGIAPVSKVWYLRFGVDWDMEEQENLVGRFDLTLPENLVGRFEEVVLSEGGNIEKENSLTYFNSIKA